MWTRLAATATALALITGGALAQRTDITIGAQLEPPNLDPTAGAAAAIDEVVYANVFEGLTRIRCARRSIQPALGAVDWTISEDGLTYTFNVLVEGATFHDGAELRPPQDVVFSIERAHG